MTDDNTKPCQAAAIKYAELGYYVFPIKPGERKSRLSKKYSEDGKNWGMSNNPATVNKNWNSFRDDSNIGLVTGSINGFFVIDVDTSEGHDVDGEETFRKLKEENGNNWPETYQVRTPTGGTHYYFLWPEDKDVIIITNSGKLGPNTKTPGIDVRAEGGMVLAPPSIRSDKDDRKYIQQGRNTFAPAPKWLLKLLIEKPIVPEPSKVEASIDKLIECMKHIPNTPNTTWEYEDPKTGEITTRAGWDGWNTIGMSLFRASGQSDAGFKIFDDWCKQNTDKYKDGKYIRYSWFTRWRRTPPKKVTAAILIGLANTYSPGWHAIWNNDHPEEVSEYREERREKDSEKTLAGIAKGEYIIKVYEDDLHKAVDLTETSLLANKSPMYIHSKELVTPTVTELNTSKKDIKTKIAAFSPIDADYLTDHVNRFIDYKKYNIKEKNWKSIDPPQKVIVRLLSRKNELRFPKVAGLITTQTMRPDGSLLTIPGWDENTGLLLIDPPPMKPIENKPSRGAVLESKELLIDLIEEVKHSQDDDGVSLAVLLSQIMTPVLRGAFPVCPMHVNRSPSPGSGKSYMFDIVAHIVIGQHMPVMAAGRNAEETEKRLGAALMAGQPLISIDNIAGELGGDAICQIIERPIVNIRVLGKSELRTIAARGTSLYCNGNNMVLTGDVVRRAIIATIDTGLERPELRIFKKDPISMIMADRGKYIAACLTLARAYIVAGQPDKPSQLGSFGEWSDIIRGTIMWIGMADPVKSMEIGRNEDPELRAHSDFCKCVFEIMGGGQQYKYSASEIIDEAQTSGTVVRKGFDDDYGFKWPEFQMIVQQIAGFHSRPPEALRLGKWMQFKKNRPIDGLVIKSKQHGNHVVWWIEKVGNPNGNFAGKNAPGNPASNVRPLKPGWPKPGG